MFEEACDLAGDRMLKTIEVLKKNLAIIKTGRASVSLFNNIHIDYYGVSSLLDKVATITIAEPRLIVIKPWDKSIVKVIEKTIHESNLGLNPTIDENNNVRVPIPFLTEERRKEFVKQARQRSEEARISCRNIRRETNEHLKILVKEGKISEDDEKRGNKSVQDLTNKFILEVDRLFDCKELEIMRI
jgi:ribosome recycling factor